MGLKKIKAKKKRCSENMKQIYRKHPCRSVISIKLLCNFIEIAHRHGCSPVNLVHIFRIPFTKNTPGLWMAASGGCFIAEIRIIRLINYTKGLVVIIHQRYRRSV